MSSTSYFDRRVVEREDESDVVSLFFYTPAGLPPVFSQITEIKPLHRFVQEIRFASQLSGPVQFVAGTYFSQTNGQSTPGYYPQTIVPGLTDVSGYPGDLFFYQNYPSSIREPAVFGEVSYQVAKPLKLTAGARWYEIKSTASGTEQGAAVGAVVVDSPSTLTEVGVNPKFQADYQLTRRCDGLCDGGEGVPAGWVGAHRARGGGSGLPGAVGCVGIDHATNPQVSV